MLPQASGIAMARTPRMIGAFHGAMPSTTPTGWRIAIAMLARNIRRHDFAGDLRGHRGRFAQHARGEMHVEVPPAARRAGLGRSGCVANCAARASSRSAALSSMARRALGPDGRPLRKRRSSGIRGSLARPPPRRPQRAWPLHRRWDSAGRMWRTFAAGTSRPAMSNLTSSIVVSGRASSGERVVGLSSWRSR